MQTWLVLWECLCSDAGTDPAVFPERCPGHDRPRITDARSRTNPVEMPLAANPNKPMAPGHRCGHRVHHRCPDVAALDVGEWAS